MYDDMLMHFCFSSSKRNLLLSWCLPDIGEFCIGRLCDRCSSSLPCGIIDSSALWKDGLEKADRKPEPKWPDLTVIWPQAQSFRL